MSADPNIPEQGDSERLDELDRAIIAELQYDGRATYRAIGKALEVPEATVRFRINRMQRSGLLSITVFTHPQGLGGGILASLALRVAAPRRAAVIDELQSWDEIMYLSSCLGPSDIMLQVVTRDLRELEDVLVTRLAALEGVRDIDVFVELKVHKTGFKRPPPGAIADDYRK